MKKLILTILASSFLLSCSTDSSNNSSNLLPSKIISNGPTAPGIDNNFVTNYEYSGSKLLRTFRDDGSYECVFTYSGNLLTNEVITSVSNGAQYVTNITFEYDNSNRLILYSQGSFKMEYTYLSNNLVSQKSYQLDNNSGQFELAGENILTLNADNDIIQVAFENGIIKTFVYDNRNNPFKNVTGWDKLNFVYNEGINHNVLNVSQDNGQNYQEYFYTYNDLNYPVTRQGTGGTIQYFYN